MTHHYWMKEALKLAEQAQQQGEVPVGAVVVLENQIIGRGFNQPISTNDPTAHAEIIALRQAANTIGNYRLLNTQMYVTLEPCVMCAGAMLHARISELIYAASDFRAGAVHSVFSLLNNSALNHSISWQDGILADECSQLLSEFFKSKRGNL